MTKRAAILARISDADAGETAGVDDQVKDMRAFVARRGWTLQEEHVLVENDTSAFKRRKIKLPNGRTELRTVRPKFRRALELLETRAVDVLVVLDLDRLARQPRDLEDLIDLVEASHFGVTCESLTGSCQLTSDAGITMARIMCAVANKSSKDTARRVSRARQRQAEAGQFGGGRRPYGFEPDGVTIRPDEARVLRRMSDAALAGVPIKAITRDLVTEGIPAADGKAWSAAQVRDVLMRPRNAALMVHRPGHDKDKRKAYAPEDVVGTAPWEPIVPADEFWAVVSKLSDPSRRTNRGVAPKHLGSGVYTCPCGAVVRVTGSSGKRDRPVYACRTTGGGTHASAPQADLDALVESVAIVLLARDAADLMTPATSGVDLGAIRAELATVRERRTLLGQDYDDGLMDRAEYLTRIKRLDDRVTKLQAELDAGVESSPLAPFAGVESEDAVREVWEGLGVGVRREILRTIMRVELVPAGRGRRPAIVDRVRITPVAA